MNSLITKTHTLQKLVQPQRTFIDCMHASSMGWRIVEITAEIRGGATDTAGGPAAAAARRSLWPAVRPVPVLRVSRADKGSSSSFKSVIAHYSASCLDPVTSTKISAARQGETIAPRAADPLESELSSLPGRSAASRHRNQRCDGRGVEWAEVSASIDVEQER